ncbi:MULTISPECIES: APC family permease [unclassified Mycolicibacterium]|uniref:APC family permease n=1 Tax=unclassified Mycolicibacterium TaxID=2636767 RepID=UPI0012DC0480|nr:MULTISPECIES: APC family permease [unclassified Mycolicibacterium]MUL82257.1 APC family permease [Mycolicibacterium sp. CBMA 329]MUL88023.1 APC family permease [Mycolicibacterium sp. CBMA 331]MUM02354.1 APC family permease [Mycolicibacterium sp. CBMA 334]MUM29112.1 APC family permease [Mycolicibacterium sp. CBMA 295]MUM38320.1 APC family permease [Mycolicibacterium sp. CBMA 247]
MTNAAAPPEGLRAGAVTLPGAIMQSIATMSPAVSVIFAVPFLAVTAGYLSPLAVFLAAVVSYLLGYSLAQLTRHLRSAGSYGSFTRQLIGPRAAFMVSWVYLLFYPVATAMLTTLLGSTLHQILLTNYGINIPWWLPMLVLIAVVAVLAHRGVEMAVGVVVVLGLAEILIMLALCVWCLFVPGDGGTSISWIWGHNSPGMSGFFLGFIFSIYNLTGWDNAATLGEETSNPLKNVPRAVLGSILIMGVFVVITTWGEITGWGTNQLASMADSEIPPIFVLAERHWGGAWVLAPIAMVTAIIGACLACMNASIRIFYEMGRTGTLPAILGRLNRNYTPGNAVVLQTILNVGVGFLLVATVGLSQVFAFTGLLFVFALNFVYVLANVAVWRLYRTRARSEFNVIKHGAVPLVGAVALVAVSYMSLNPLPEAPLNWALPVVVAWFIVGLAVLVIRSIRGDTEWLTRSEELETIQDSEPVTPRITEPL